MYERPTLNRVGEAQDVILGITATGNDVDTSFLIENMEFADDGDFEPRA